MGSSDLRQFIRDLLTRLIQEKDLPVPDITDEMILLGDELPIDSLDLALVVTELEERTGKDPFANGFVEFNTVAELADLYAR